MQYNEMPYKKLYPFKRLFFMRLTFRHLYSSYRTDGVTIATSDTPFTYVKPSLSLGDALNRTIYGTRTALNTSIIYIKL